MTTHSAFAEIQHLSPKSEHTDHQRSFSDSEASFVNIDFLLQRT